MEIRITTITVTVPVDALSNRDLEQLDHAVDQIADIPGVSVRGWTD